MRLFTDTKLAERNAKIGKYGSTLGLVILLGLLVFNVYSMGQPQLEAQIIWWLGGGMFLGLIVNAVGISFNQRWGRRADLGLTNALKGLDDRYTLYNYRLGAAHVLLGPHGASVLVPKYQAGQITGRKEAVKGRGKKDPSVRYVWQAPATRKLGGLFNVDPVGDPLADAALEVDSLKRFLKKRAPTLPLAPQAIVVFMQLHSDVKAPDAPLPVLHFKQLKEYIRRQPRNINFAPDKAAAQLEAALGLAPATAAASD